MNKAFFFSQNTVPVVDGGGDTGGAGDYDADAQAYFDALLAADVIPSSAQMDSINIFILNAKENGWWDTKAAIYFPVWRNALADAINLKSPGTYDLTFVGSPGHTSNGIAWNGTSQYANTGLPWNSIEQNSFSLSYYSQTNSAAGTYEIGAYSSTTSSACTLSADRGNGTQMIVRINCLNSTFVSKSGGSTGLFSGIRTASNITKGYKNGVQQDATIGNASNTSANLPIYIGAFNYNNSPSGYSNKKMSYSDIGTGLTSSQEASHYTDVQALHTAFEIAL